MTRDQLIELLSDRFYDNFADQVAQRVRDQEAVAELYSLVTGDCTGFKRDVRHKIMFRGAYVLERIYFSDPELFAPFVDSFCQRDFCACEDPSARRHFTKIMTHLLGVHSLDNAVIEAIAQDAGEWALDERARVAVRIGAVSVLSQCRQRVGWVDESWDDLIAAISNNPSPAICARLRNGWRRRF